MSVVRNTPSKKDDSPQCDLSMFVAMLTLQKEFEKDMSNPKLQKAYKHWREFIDKINQDD